MVQRADSNGYAICKDLGSIPTYDQWSFLSVRLLHSMCLHYLARGYQGLHVKQTKKKKKRTMLVGGLSGVALSSPHIVIQFKLWCFIAKSQSPKPSEAGLENYITDSFIKEGSLKAHKAEKDRLAEELAEEERLKNEKADKRQKSGRKVS